VARQHSSGRLDVRQRLERLFDPGTFHETGAIAGKASYDEHGELVDFLPANMLIGQGRIDGRRAVVQGDDFTVARRRRRRRDLAEDGLRRADGARSARAAGPAGRRDGRRRQRQVTGDDGLHLRARSCRASI